jgi:hypothetical protein
VINHARTALLNVSSTGNDSPWAEFIPHDFRPRQLTRGLSRIRAILFGHSPDRYMLDYRMLQLIPLLHSLDLETFTLADDTRVTYTQRNVDPAIFVPQVTADKEVSPPVLAGNSDADDSHGRLFCVWHITVDDYDFELLDEQTRQAWVFPLEIASNSFSVPIRLPGSNWYISIPPTPNTGWQIVTVLRPSATAANLYRVLAEVVTEADLLDLFGVSPAEPQQSYQNLWMKHPAWPVRLGALLLGMADRTLQEGYA